MRVGLGVPSSLSRKTFMIESEMFFKNTPIKRAETGQ